MAATSTSSTRRGRCTRSGIRRRSGLRADRRVTSNDATASLYDGLAEILPPGMVAVADNGDGDYLLLDPASRPVIWRHESGEFEPADVDWERDRPSPRRRSHRREAIDRVAETLTRLGRAEISVAVVHAPRTEMYIQFRRVDDGIVGEAVGEQNLPKLTVVSLRQLPARRLTGAGLGCPARPRSRCRQLDANLERRGVGRRRGRTRRRADLHGRVSPRALGAPDLQRRELRIELAAFSRR